MKKSFLTLGAAFALAGVSQAAGTWIIDNFDNYTDGVNMNGLTSAGSINTWAVTNGVATPGGEDISIATSYTFDLSTGAALIGGFDPTVAAPTVLSTAANIAMFNTTTPIIGNPARFTIDFGFLDSTDANRDDYSISLTSTGGGNLLTIDLTPSANVNTYNLSFSSDFFTGVVNWGTIDALDTFGSPYFSLEFATGSDGIGGMFYSLKDLNNNTLMSDGALTGTALTDDILGLDISVDTNGASGDGFLVIDNVSLIPEPSSALLGLLGATLAFTRRRRA